MNRKNLRRRSLLKFQCDFHVICDVQMTSGETLEDGSTKVKKLVYGESCTPITRQANDVIASTALPFLIVIHEEGGGD